MSLSLAFSRIRPGKTGAEPQEAAADRNNRLVDRWVPGLSPRKGEALGLAVLPGAAGGALVVA
jgi:hypothetical protein